MRGKRRARRRKQGAVAVGKSLGASFPSFLASATIREYKRKPGQANKRFRAAPVLMEYRGKGSDGS
jgi:hypothetical protein